MRLRGAAFGIDLLRVVVGQLFQFEGAGIGHLARRCDRVGPAGEQALHLCGGFQVPFGIGVKQMAGLGDRGLVADRGHHVLQRAAFGRVVVDVVGGKDRQCIGACEHVEPLDPGDVIACMEEAGGEVLHARQLAGEVREQVGICGGVWTLGRSLRLRASA